MAVITDNKFWIRDSQIKTEFLVLKESTHLDLYWTNTIKEVIASNTQKRKLDSIIEREVIESSKRSEKDRRLSNTLTNNNILDLSNEGNCSQTEDIENWSNLKSQYTNDYRELPILHCKTIEAIDEVMDKKPKDVFKRYIKSLNHQTRCPEDAVYIYKIISIVINAMCSKPALFDPTILPEPSEQDLVVNIWGPVLEALFVKTNIVVKCGDTVFADVNNKHKIDFRLGIIINNSFVDIANVEDGKKATTTKIKDDHVKLLLEAKTIIKRIISKYHFINPSTTNVYSLQVCGLKADLLETTLISESTYITDRVCERIRIPLNETQASQAKNFIQSMMLFREEVQRIGRIVEMDVVKAIDRRSSFGRVFKPGFKDNLPIYSNWIEGKQA